MSVDRRDVAERLRAKHRERNALGMFEAQDLGLQALGYLEDLEECLPDGDSAFTVIADLIDPTCHNRQIAYNRTSPQEFRTDNFICSACGETFCADGWVYCPSCGARVVNIDDAD